MGESREGFILGLLGRVFSAEGRDCEFPRLLNSAMDGSGVDGGKPLFY
jgi:hypothetical protein